MVDKFTDLLGREYKGEVLRFLKDNQDDFFSINEIAGKTSGSNPSVKNFLEDLSDLGLIKFRKKAGSYLVEYNQDSRYDEAVKSILKVEIKELRQEASKYAFRLFSDEDIGDNIESVVLYGSVARGTADANSDIDLLILVKDTADSEHVRERALEISREKSGEEIEIVPVVQSIQEFREGFTRANRFENNVVRDGEVLRGKNFDDLL